MIRRIGYAAPDKEADARHLGADDVVLSTDKETMSKHELSDFIVGYYSSFPRYKSLREPVFDTSRSAGAASATGQ